MIDAEIIAKWFERNHSFPWSQNTRTWKRDLLKRVNKSRIKYRFYISSIVQRKIRKKSLDFNIDMNEAQEQVEKNLYLEELNKKIDELIFLLSPEESYNILLQKINLLKPKSSLILKAFFDLLSLYNKYLSVSTLDSKIMRRNIIGCMMGPEIDRPQLKFLFDKEFNYEYAKRIERTLANNYE